MYRLLKYSCLKLKCLLTAASVKSFFELSWTLIGEDVLKASSPTISGVLTTVYPYMWVVYLKICIKNEISEYFTLVLHPVLEIDSTFKNPGTAQCTGVHIHLGICGSKTSFVTQKSINQTYYYLHKPCEEGRVKSKVI